jgi:hypothetical protein
MDGRRRFANHQNKIILGHTRRFILIFYIDAKNNFFLEMLEIYWQRWYFNV